MLPVAVYPAILATVISIIGLTQIAHAHHDRQRPSTLSELAAAHDRLLTHFRTILWICGTLFAITLYGFVIPRIQHPVLIAVAWTVTYLGNLALAIIPARGKTHRIHTFLAQAMAAGMLALAYLFWFSLHGSYSFVEMAASILMSLLAILTIMDKQRFIFYELPFLYASHISIVIAGIALVAIK